MDQIGPLILGPPGSGTVSLLATAGPLSTMNLGLHLRLSWTILLLPLLLLLPFLYFSIGLLPIDVYGTNRQLTNFHLHRGQSEMELKYLNKFFIIAYD